MKRLAIAALIGLITVAAGTVSFSDRLAAVGPRATASTSASSARIVQEPALESATSTSVIVRWTTISIEGTAVRYGVVHYGVDRRNLNQTAKSQNRYNRGLPTMIYRVQLYDLEPGMTYFYTVEFTDAKGVTEGVALEPRQFTTQPR